MSVWALSSGSHSVRRVPDRAARADSATARSALSLAARRRAFPKCLVNLVLEPLKPRHLWMPLLSEHGFELRKLVAVEFDVLADLPPVGVTTCLGANLPGRRLSSKRSPVPEQLRKFIVSDIARWRKVVKDAGIKLD